MAYLPNEIWTEVFRHIPRPHLRTVHSVSTLFHDISQPLLFQRLELGLEPARPSVEDLNERLIFLSSPMIAPCVRRFTIYTRDWPEGMPPWLFSLDSPHPRIIAALRTVPSFINLRSLTLHIWTNARADLSRLGLETLHNLDELLMLGCSYYSPQTQTAFKIRVRRLYLQFSSLSDHTVEYPRLRRSWLPMFDPEALRVLELGFHQVGTEWLTDDIAPPAEFPNLRVLCLACPSVSCTQLRPILARFPSVRKFVFDGQLLDTPTHPLHAQLEVFSGPCSFLPLVLPLAGCRELDIRHSAVAGLVHTFTTAGRAPSVTSLALTISLLQLFAWTEPRVVFDLLPNLETLHLRISASITASIRHDVTHTSYPQILSRLLSAPRALRRVIIRAENLLPFTGSEGELRDILLIAVPNLVNLYFVYKLY
ncbi:hypothetical protein B0H19DRAFT_1184553 [Mycena capillaripes]|nr:hypothetical protein B0H19DRAFT_1184553 [Mycena capillaripes]